MSSATCRNTPYSLLVSSKCLFLICFSYQLHETFQVPVDANSVKAKFSKAKKTLTITANTRMDLVV